MNPLWFSHIFPGVSMSEKLLPGRRVFTHTSRVESKARQIYWLHFHFLGRMGSGWGGGSIQAPVNCWQLFLWSPRSDNVDAAQLQGSCLAMHLQRILTHTYTERLQPPRREAGENPSNTRCCAKYIFLHVRIINKRRKDRAHTDTHTHTQTNTPSPVAWTM